MKLADLQRLFKTKATGRALKEVEVLDAQGEILAIANVVYDSENDKVFIITE